LFETELHLPPAFSQSARVVCCAIVSVDDEPETPVDGLADGVDGPLRSVLELLDGAEVLGPLVDEPLVAPEPLLMPEPLLEPAPVLEPAPELPLVPELPAAPPAPLEPEPAAPAEPDAPPDAPLPPEPPPA
jgi:hypothetical protein